jgi:threonine synthase
MFLVISGQWSMISKNQDLIVKLKAEIVNFLCVSVGVRVPSVMNYLFRGNFMPIENRKSPAPDKGEIVNRPTGSTITHLECTFTGETYAADELQNLSKAGKVLYPRYDLQKAKERLSKEELKNRAPNLWRYKEVLPVLWEENIVSLGEGFTPLLSVPRLAERTGLEQLLVKDEGVNPTGSFKARGMTAAVSKAKELGATALAVPSAGNAGGALAAYAARAGIPATVIMPDDAPLINKLETAVTGAQTYLIKGLINDAGRVVRVNSPKYNWFDLSTLKEPYRVEGKKTMGYEVAEQLNWELPDVIIYPAGGGTGLVGMWKAFAEMEEMGWIGSKRPRMILVQAEGCAPIVRAYDEGVESARLWENAQTGASGLRVPIAVGDYLMIRAVRESGGTCLMVSDADMLTATKEIAHAEGLYVAPEGAATYVALKRLLEAGQIKRTEQVVLFNTGTGLKYPEFLNFDYTVLPGDTNEI